MAGPAPQLLVILAWGDGHEVPLDGGLAHAAGMLFGQAFTSDVIDGSIAFAAAGARRRGDVAVVTSDRDDLYHLLSVLYVAVTVVEV